MKPKNLIVFDMDGVIIDVSNSYRDVVRQTTKQFFSPAKAAEHLPEPLFELSDLAVVKQSGGLNNDWDLTVAVINLLFTLVDAIVITDDRSPLPSHVLDQLGVDPAAREIDQESTLALEWEDRHRDLERSERELGIDVDADLKAGLIAIKLNDDDELVDVIPTNGVHDILLSSRLGQTIRFSEDLVRPMGRSAGGVRGLKLKEGDEVVSCAPGRSRRSTVPSSGPGRTRGASAPPTISKISLVIACWRTLLYAN